MSLYRSVSCKKFPVVEIPQVVKSSQRAMNGVVSCRRQISMSSLLCFYFHSFVRSFVMIFVLPFVLCQEEFRWLLIDLELEGEEVIIHSRAR